MTTRAIGISGIGAACAAAAALLLAPATAAAQSGNGTAYAGSSWSLKTVKNGTEQCMMIVNHGAMGLDAAGTRIDKEADSSGTVAQILWYGRCNADGLIDGRGILYIDLDESGSYYSKRFIGTADRGVLTGGIDYNGFYDLESDEYDVLDPDKPLTFVNGCNNWAGTQTDSCDTGRADRLRGQYLASRETAPGVSNPAPQPVAATTAQSAGPVAVDIPPSQTAKLNDEQNTAAAAWLESDAEARRIQAEKVAEFERNQAEFERQQAEYARQQAEYKAALAAQQAEVARITQANADAQACYRGDKSRCY